MSYKISVIIPVYNVEKYLDQCVQSVLNQTLPDVEIVLVDDQSPDRCPMMCDQYSQTYPNIKVVHKQNAGLGMACNSGLDVASGEYVAFLDSDDWVEKDMYQTMVDSADKNHSDMVFTGLTRVNNDGSEIGRLEHRGEFQLFEGNSIRGLAKDMIASSPEISLERTIQMSAKVVLYRRSVIEDNGIRFVSEREVISEDLHFNLQVLTRSNRVCILPVFLYNYRITPNSISQKVSFERFERYKHLHSYLIHECEDLGLPDYIDRVHRLFIGYSRSYICQVFNSFAPFADKREIVGKICKDPIWKAITKDYPVSQMPKIHRLFLWATNHDFFLLLMVMSRLKR